MNLIILSFNLLLQSLICDFPLSFLHFCQHLVQLINIRQDTTLHLSSQGLFECLVITPWEMLLLFGDFLGYSLHLHFLILLIIIRRVIIWRIHAKFLHTRRFGLTWSINSHFPHHPFHLFGTFIPSYNRWNYLLSVSTLFLVINWDVVGSIVLQFLCRLSALISPSIPFKTLFFVYCEIIILSPVLGFIVFAWHL